MTTREQGYTLHPSTSLLLLRLRLIPPLLSAEPWAPQCASVGVCVDLSGELLAKWDWSYHGPFLPTAAAEAAWGGRRVTGPCRGGQAPQMSLSGGFRVWQDLAAVLGMLLH